MSSLRQTHPNYYELLEVSPRASFAVIKAAYRCLVQMHHPDKQPDDASAAARLVEINQAYAVLSDPIQRKHYDLAVRHDASSGDRRGAGVAFAAKREAEPEAGVSRWPVSRAFAFRPLN